MILRIDDAVSSKGAKEAGPPGSGHENVSGLAPLSHAVVVMGLDSLRKPCASCTTSSVATLPVRPTRLSFEDEWEAPGMPPGGGEEF